MLAETAATGVNATKEVAIIELTKVCTFLLNVFLFVILNKQSRAKRISNTIYCYFIASI
ncbi:hypothetical protein PSPO_a2216 [Pseudoalteromonas spongiae UST010723-006]|nr:hypothetical protein PSPO_a2216 [Pseudoalteromonas spongiae UST010723-006]